MKKCPKCGSEDVSTRYVQDWSSHSCGEARDCQRAREHLYKHCRCCGYGRCEPCLDSADARAVKVVPHSAKPGQGT